MRILALVVRGQQGSAEIHVSEDLSYTMPRHALALLQASRALRKEVLQSVVTFVFKRAAALNLFVTGAFSSLPLLVSPPQMSSIRLVALDALETVRLPLEGREACGSEGPHITPLFQGWMDTAQHLQDTVAVIELDLSHSFPLMFDAVARFVQRMSTAVHLRSGKYTKFQISGCRTLGTLRYTEDCTCALLLKRKRKEQELGWLRRNGLFGPGGEYFYFFGQHGVTRWGEVEAKPSTGEEEYV